MSTFLELTNKLLRRMNEVELTAGNFASSYSIQSVAKDAVIAAVNEIIQKEDRWPFLFLTGSQVLTPGTEDYAFADTVEFVHWETFQIEKDLALNINTTHLGLINKDEYFARIEPQDADTGVDGRGVPAWVFPTVTAASRGFGVTPSPTQAYTVTYQYYKIPDEMSTYSDVCVIPQRFDHHIIDVALKHFYAFRDNQEAFQMQVKIADGAVSRMSAILIPKKDTMVDTRVNFGGDNRSTAFRPGGRY